MVRVAVKQPKQVFKNHWHAWVDTRSSRAQSHRLHHKNLYILPTAAGWAFLLLALIIWLLGTNYQNNLILALSYLQLSLMVVVILHTYNNMSGLYIESLGADEGHAGQRIDFKFQVMSDNAFGCHYLKLGWADTVPTLYDIEGSSTQLVRVGVKANQRGRFWPGRLLVQSEFPMGLVKCWSWLRFENEVIVYPRPVERALPVVLGGSAEGTGEVEPDLDGEEFLGYRQYHPGDGLRRIAWKQYARERGLYSKVYGSGRANNEYLYWSQFFSGDVELALSQMTYWAVAWHRENRGFGLSLPTVEIAFGSGDAHLAEVLSALAVYGQS